MENENEILDVTEQVSTEIIQDGVIIAQQKDSDVLILKACESTERFDGKKGVYRIEYRWLSNPDNVHSVQGNETTLWTKSEMDPVLKRLNQGETLFDCFQPC